MSQVMSQVPKIIHQLWIGDKPEPTNLMNTWRDKHPNFKYIKWDEKLLLEYQHIFTCNDRVDEIEEINGKADIIRWEILYEFGGVFIDADSICIEPIDDIINKPFASYENETARPGLIATGTMGFPPKHPLVFDAINWIKNNSVSKKDTGLSAWETVGPLLLTKLYNLHKNIHIYPSYYFLPEHYSGLKYNKHGKVYGYQEWGSTKKHNVHEAKLPSEYLKPEKSVSVLVSSYNTPIQYLEDCLEGIQNQQGFFNIELVWINDGSDILHTNILINKLNEFKMTTRFTNIVHYNNDENKGIGYSLNRGIQLCSHEIIIKMDSDDKSVTDRIQKQLLFMEKNQHLMIIGSAMHTFTTLEPNKLGTFAHQHITWDEYKKAYSNKSPVCSWFINHPTCCYRKSAILEIGNYNDNLRTLYGDDSMIHDFELELRMLKKYGFIYNTQDKLVYYRLHDKQVTNSKDDKFWNNIRDTIIKNFID